MALVYVPGRAVKGGQVGIYWVTLIYAPSCKSSSRKELSTLVRVHVSHGHSRSCELEMRGHARMGSLEGMVHSVSQLLSSRGNHSRLVHLQERPVRQLALSGRFKRARESIPHSHLSDKWEIVGVGVLHGSCGSRIYLRRHSAGSLGRQVS